MAKPFVEAGIKIPFAPPAVKAVFLDFDNFADMKSMIIDIKRKAGARGPILEGEVLDIYSGVGWGTTTITESTTDTLSWYGTYMMGCGAGKHTFYFLPSEMIPGYTTFKHKETPYRIGGVLFYLTSMQKMFDRFCADFKARCEVVLGGSNS